MELTEEQLANTQLRPVSLEAAHDPRAEFITRDGRRAKFVYHLEEGAEYYKLYWHVPDADELVATTLSGRFADYGDDVSIDIFQVPVGIVEGKAVYPGDRLYWGGSNPEWVTATYPERGDLFIRDIPGRGDSRPDVPNGFPFTYLSWTEPAAPAAPAQEPEPEPEPQPTHAVVVTPSGAFGPFPSEEAQAQADKLGGFVFTLQEPGNV